MRIPIKDCEYEGEHPKLNSYFGIPSEVLQTGPLTARCAVSVLLFALHCGTLHCVMFGLALLFYVMVWGAWCHPPP